MAADVRMAPGGVEPPRADSKSAALSAELRGREPQFALEPVVRLGREPDAEYRQCERDGEVEPADPDFDVPTTIDDHGSRLYAVNARFGTPPTPTTRYDVVQVAKR